MLYYNFKNYEEFKKIFGVVEHGNGEKSRKNKILLALYKDRDTLRRHIEARGLQAREEIRCHFAARRDSAQSAEAMAIAEEAERRSRGGIGPGSCILDATDLSTLKTRLLDKLEHDGDGARVLQLNGRAYRSGLYETDDMQGLCEDGTLNAIRYRNTERGRLFKMKAGKMFNHIISCCPPVDALPEQVKRWLSEEFVADWVAYAQENISGGEYTLHVDDDFESIYDSGRCSGNFHSCMTDECLHTFYRDAVKASAAYLTNEDGCIVARCVIFTEVYDGDSGETFRLAERQYASGGDENLKRMLVNALIRGGHIDGYKRIGAGCSDSMAFVLNDGTSLAGRTLYIACDLAVDDTLSYQDSFKYYDIDEGRAYNDSSMDYDHDLAVTGGQIAENHDGEIYSDYNDEYIPEDEAYYVETRGDHFHRWQVVDAHVYGGCGRYRVQTCFEDDCVAVGSDYYYAGDDAEAPEYYGLRRCDRCGGYYVPAKTGTCHSELTGEDYCSEDCMEISEGEYKEDNWAY